MITKLGSRLVSYLGIPSMLGAARTGLLSDSQLARLNEQAATEDPETSNEPLTRSQAMRTNVGSSIVEALKWGAPGEIYSLIAKHEKLPGGTRLGRALAAGGALYGALKGSEGWSSRGLKE